jgi:hypothetical protein
VLHRQKKLHRVPVFIGEDFLEELQRKFSVFYVDGYKYITRSSKV